MVVGRVWEYRIRIWWERAGRQRRLGRMVIQMGASQKRIQNAWEG